MSNLGHGVYDVDPQAQQEWERRCGEWEYREAFGELAAMDWLPARGWVPLGLTAGQRSMIFGRRRKDWESVTTYGAK